MTRGNETYRHRFPAMGTTVELVLVGGATGEALAAFALAEVLAAEWDHTFSRFRPDSELSRLNAGAGQPVAVSERMFGALELALAGADATGGLFDPTVHDALVALGYDRTFAAIVPDAGAESPPVPVPGAAGIVLERRTRTVQLTPGTKIDLGGVAKGMYADEITRQLAGWAGGAVSAGGDLAVWGLPPSGERWVVGVEDPADPARDVRTIEVSTGGVATSGINRRWWRRDGQIVHHLIDPRTSRPARSHLLAVTAVGTSASTAEIAATALFIGGWSEESLERLRPLFTRGVALTDRGEVLQSWGNPEGASRGRPTTGVAA